MSSLYSRSKEVALPEDQRLKRLAEYREKLRTNWQEVEEDVTKIIEDGRHAAKVVADDPGLSLVAGAVHPPVHLGGGPCVDTAPEREQFVPLDDIISVTCPACRTAIAMLGADLSSIAETDPYAAAVAKQDGESENVDPDPPDPNDWVPSL